VSAFKRKKIQKTKNHKLPTRAPGKKILKRSPTLNPAHYRNANGSWIIIKPSKKVFKTH
jgi:hypothetical protein